MTLNYTPVLQNASLPDDLKILDGAVYDAAAAIHTAEVPLQAWSPYRRPWH
jgi:hypothetical protein